MEEEREVVEDLRTEARLSRSSSTISTLWLPELATTSLTAASPRSLLRHPSTRVAPRRASSRAVWDRQFGFVSGF